MQMPGEGILSQLCLTNTEFRPRIKRKQKTNPRLPGFNVTVADDANSSLFIGTVWIGTTNNALPCSLGKKFKAAFFEKADNSFLRLSFDECELMVMVTTENEFLEGKCLFFFC